MQKGKSKDQKISKLWQNCDKTVESYGLTHNTMT